MHPVLLMYEQGEGGTASCLAYSFFKRDAWEETRDLDYYGGTTYDAKANYSFPHTLADIVMAAIGSGLTLQHQHTETKPPPGMTMVWHKPD